MVKNNLSRFLYEEKIVCYIKQRNKNILDSTIIVINGFTQWPSGALSCFNQPHSCFRHFGLSALLIIFTENEKMMYLRSGRKGE